MKNFLFIVFLFFVPVFHAQHPGLDSLAYLLPLAGKDSSVVLQIAQISCRLTGEKACGEGELYVQKAVELSQETGYRRGLALASASLARLQGRLKKYNDAERNFARAEKIALALKDYEILEKVYDWCSMYYEEKRDYRNAYKYHVLFSEAEDSVAQDRAGVLPTVRVNHQRVAVADTGSYRFNRNSFLILVAALIVIVLLFVSRRSLKKRADRTRQRLAEQEMSARSVIAAEEKERSRIVRELNESIGQQISAAKLNISAFQSSLGSMGDENRAMLQNTVHLLDESVKEVRNMSQSVVPNSLLQAGFVKAVYELADKIRSSGNLEVELEIVGDIPRFDQTRETVLFRIVQEAVMNVLSHAAAKEMIIQLVKHETELSIMIEDDGRGFKVEEVLKDEKAVGLKSVQSRVAFLNGTVFFDSRPGKGTTVSIELPL